MNALGRFVHEQTLGKVWCVALGASLVIGKLTATEAHTFNRPVMWTIMVPVTIVLLIAYYSYKAKPAES